MKRLFNIQVAQINLQAKGSSRRSRRQRDAGTQLERSMALAEHIIKMPRAEISYQLE